MTSDEITAMMRSAYELGKCDIGAESEKVQDLTNRLQNATDAMNTSTQYIANLQEENRKLKSENKEIRKGMASLKTRLECRKKIISQYMEYAKEQSYYIPNRSEWNKWLMSHNHTK